MIKLAVLDVDGTLTDSERRIGPEIMQAVPKVQGKGVTISLVSGNVIPVMYALRTFLGINGPAFGENGGIMLVNDDITPFFSPEVPREYYQILGKRIKTYSIMSNRWRETSVAFWGDREEILDEIDGMEKEWKEKVEVVDSTYAWHILNRGENKAFAVNKLKELYSLEPGEILVVGDSDNDYSMYETDSVKAAIENSTERIKENSEYVSELPNGKGVIDVLNHYGLL